jgi:hypothetical protein
MDLTDDELQRLGAATSTDQWNDLCAEVKKSRNGAYPGDWYQKVLASGLARRVLASFGETDEIEIRGVDVDAI